MLPMSLSPQWHSSELCDHPIMTLRSKMKPGHQRDVPSTSKYDINANRLSQLYKLWIQQLYASQTNENNKSTKCKEGVKKSLLCESPNKSNNVINISWFVRVKPHWSFGVGPVFAGKVWIISMRRWSNSQKIPLKARDLWPGPNTFIFYRAIRNDLLSVFNDLCGWYWTAKQAVVGVLVGRDEQVTNWIFLLLSHNAVILKRVTCSQLPPLFTQPSRFMMTTWLLSWCDSTNAFHTSPPQIQLNPFYSNTPGETRTAHCFQHTPPPRIPPVTHIKRLVAQMFLLLDSSLCAAWHWFTHPSYA